MKSKAAAPRTAQQQIAGLSVELVTMLARDWPGHGSYDNLRGAVIYAVHAALAQRQGLFAPPLEMVEPALPATAVALLRLRLDAALSGLAVDAYLFGHVHETLAGYQLLDGDIVPSTGRRKGGVHFTPAELTDKVVARTLEPLLACLAPTASVLDLRICDPAVGAGAFLISLVRQLAPRVLLLGEAHDFDEAKRLVAIHCAHGVDKCPLAVYAAKLALRLECRADRMPASWLDDNIRTGDALVGLDRDQFVRFDAGRKAPEQPQLAQIWDDAVNAAAQLRRARLVELARLSKGGA
jgi:hypothetical protein